MKSGWFKEYHRHSLAARGIASSRYMRKKKNSIAGNPLLYVGAGSRTGETGRRLPKTEGTFEAQLKGLKLLKLKRGDEKGEKDARGTIKLLNRIDGREKLLRVQVADMDAAGAALQVAKRRQQIANADLVRARTQGKAGQELAQYERRVEEALVAKNKAEEKLGSAVERKRIMAEVAVLKKERAAALKVEGEERAVLTKEVGARQAKVMRADVDAIAGKEKEYEENVARVNRGIASGSISYVRGKTLIDKLTDDAREFREGHSLIFSHRKPMAGMGRGTPKIIGKTSAEKREKAREERRALLKTQKEGPKKREDAVATTEMAKMLGKSGEEGMKNDHEDGKE